jgi:hypothetical protein
MVDPIPGVWHRSSVDVTAQALDSRSGVANVALGYRHSPDEVSWSPWTYFQTDSLPPWSWLFTFPGGDGFYQLHSIGTDNASNSEWFKDWPEANATFDATPPHSHCRSVSAILEEFVDDPDRHCLGRDQRSGERDPMVLLLPRQLLMGLLAIIRDR